MQHFNSRQKSLHVCKCRREMTAIFTFRRLLLLCAVASSAYSVRESQRCDHSTAGGNDRELRLVNFNSTTAGHLEICSKGVWSKLLISDIGSWSRKNSIVVCRELGYLNALHVSSYDRYIVKNSSSGEPLQSPSVHYRSIQCNGLEGTLAECETSGSEIISPVLLQPLVMCVEVPRRGDIRLVGGSGADNQGVLQVYHPNRIYKWSTVCTNKWDDNDARVACKQLGYHGGTSALHKSSSSSFPRRRYDNYECNGSESSLAECSFDGPYPLRCFSADNQYAGVECQELNDGDSDSIGITDPRISLVVLITGVLLILIAIIGMLLRCTVKRLRKKRSSLPLTSSDPRASVGQGVQRVTLSSQYWQRNNRGYNNLSADAPPTYEETVSTVQLCDNSVEIDTHRNESIVQETTVDTLETEIDTHETDIDTRETGNNSHETDTNAHDA